MGSNTSQQQQPQGRQVNLPRVTDYQGIDVPLTQQLVIHLLNYFPNVRGSVQPSRTSTPIIVNPNTPSNGTSNGTYNSTSNAVMSRFRTAQSPIIVNPNAPSQNGNQSRSRGSANGSITLDRNGDVYLHDQQGRIIRTVQADQIGAPNARFDLAITETCDGIKIIDPQTGEGPILAIPRGGRVAVQIKDGTIQFGQLPY
jgi:hypothetical protein